MTSKRIVQNIFTLLPFALKSPGKFLKLIHVKQSHLTYLSLNRLINLSNVVLSVEKDHIPGIFIEAGCALGGSAIAISLNKAKTRKLEVYDTFAMIPPPTTNDEQDSIKRYQEILDGTAKGIQNDRYYGYEDDLLEKVIDNFNRFGIATLENQISFHKGYFEDTLKISQPVALAHIDCDWYESIITTLKQIVPMLSTNGMIIIDDYLDWHGAKKAVDEYFTDKLDTFRFSYHPQLVIKKII